MEESRGFSLAELLVVIAIASVILAMAAPALATLRAGARAAAGARIMASAFHDLRFQAVARARHRALAFTRDGARWSWRVVEDGNGNGVRSSEIRDGTDPVISGPHRLEDRVEGVFPGFPGPGPYPAVPPSRGNLDRLDDPVKFGRSDLVSFSPLGSSSSGTLYLTDGGEELWAVVLFGPTTRVRVWRYDSRGGRWVL